MKVWADLQQGKSALNDKGESLFLQNLLGDEDLRAKLSENEIRACFDYSYYTKNVDKIFARVFCQALFTAAAVGEDAFIFKPTAAKALNSSCFYIFFF